MSYPDLALRLQQSVPGSLEAFIAYTQSDCSRLAYSILRDTELTRDALQETYLLVYRKIHQLRQPELAKPWLLRILTRCCQRLLRKKGVVASFDATLQTQLEDPGLVDPAEQVGQRQQIRSTFSELSDQDRLVLGLREICSLSYEEISEVLGVPVGTVRSRLSKARQRFVERFQDLSEPRAPSHQPSPAAITS